jgi:hypothetical protein
VYTYFLCWMGSYLIGRTQRVKLEDYLSESIQCQSGVPQGSHLGPILFILDINGALNIFENVSVLRYADDQKLFKTIRCIGDCQLFQRDPDRLSEWCHSNGTTLERVDEIKDLGVIMDGRMSFLPHIEAIISKSSRMLGFIKRISRDFRDPYTHKTLYTSFVRLNLEHAACVWFILSGLSECNTISFVMRCVNCHGECGYCQLMMQDAFY